MKKTIQLTIAVAVLLILLAGCATDMAGRRIPKKVAILPFLSQGEEPGVEKLARAAMWKKMGRKRYELISFEEVDAAAAEMVPPLTEFPSAEQIVKIAGKLGADAVLAGSVPASKLEVKYLIYSKEFAAAYRLYDGADGFLLWEGSQGIEDSYAMINPKQVTDQMRELMDSDAPPEVLYKEVYLGHPLHDLIQEVTDQVGMTLPKAPRE